jgi:DNA-binding MarR family transcriptional regulator
MELAGTYQRATRARQVGIPQTELAALEHLVALGGLTPGELGHRLGLTSGGVTALAGRLRDAGLVQSDPHPSDRRMRVLTATNEAERMVAELIAPMQAPVHRAVSWLSDGDAQTVERLLDALVVLKERAAADTPGPELELSARGYNPAVLM